jgi:alpha-L-fucosidase
MAGMAELARNNYRDLPPLQQFFATVREVKAEESGGDGIEIKTTNYDDTRFYVQCYSFARFMIEATGKKNVFGSIAEADTKGIKFDAWLKQNAALYKLPPTVAELDQAYRKWLVAQSKTTAKPEAGDETNTMPAIAKGPFEPTIASLTKHQTPDWFRDAKFGIYTHWGPVAVATERQAAGQSDCWYGRYMYIPGLSGPQYHGSIPARTTFDDHRRNFGDQSTFGFKDIIPLFKAERFNADEWADLFEKSGAKFAGTVVIHHDNFAMWDSQVTRWNAVKMGPKRDLTGELEQAIHRRGLKFVASMHHAMSWFFYEPAYAYDAKDPQYSDLYCEPHSSANKDYSKDWCQVQWTPPSERFVREWLAKCDELVDKYKVDLLWHDAGMDHIPQPARLSMAAHFYNRAAEQKREVVLTYKGEDMPKGTANLDFERSGAHDILQRPWLSDTSVGKDFWYYDAGDANSFSTAELVRILVDIVSKNGCLLLNVGPHPDGTISQKQKDTLLGIGQWLKVNGEAIYGTRPWKVSGEGSNPAIRFTEKGETLYAIVLGVPQVEVKISSLGKSSELSDKKVVNVKLLGLNNELGWRQENDALIVNIPKGLSGEHALAFRIDCR